METSFETHSDISTRLTLLHYNSANIPSEIKNKLLELLDKRDISAFDNLFFSISNEPFKKLNREKQENSVEIDIKHNYEDRIKKLINEIQIYKEEIDTLINKVGGYEQEKRKQEVIIENNNQFLFKATTELQHKEAEVKKLTTQIEELQSKVQQEKIDEKIPEYVRIVKTELELDDDHFIVLSNTWAKFGVLFALMAVILSFFTFYIKVDFSNITKTELIYIFTRGILGIMLLSWLSYICLSNSKKYTHESIRRKDRRHALMFGQIFLQIYGSTASKEDALKVFKDWNMAGDSAFSDHTEQPPGFSSLVNILKEKLHTKNDTITNE